MSALTLHKEGLDKMSGLKSVSGVVLKKTPIIFLEI
jgi:hypothetical protein